LTDIFPPHHFPLSLLSSFISSCLHRHSKAYNGWNMRLTSLHTCTKYNFSFIYIKSHTCLLSFQLLAIVIINNGLKVHYIFGLLVK